ncbi:MAG: chromate transporter [Phascolarctobacterium sp.]|nr:chromate transporter [Candidatus Phascolarctobacterium caballi]
MIYWELFWSFVKVGIFCVGGGYASMPLIEAQVVQGHGWLTLQEFVDIFTISQMTPGPVGINAATFVGTKVAGIGGAVSATAGFIFPSFFIMLTLVWLMNKYGNIGAVRGLLNGLRAAVIAFIASAGFGFITLAIWNTEGIPEQFADFSWIGIIVLIVSLVAVRMKTSVIRLLCLSGVCGLILGILGLH